MSAILVKMPPAIRRAEAPRDSPIAKPMRHGPETRCFFRDPDGHLFEISEYRPG